MEDYSRQRNKPSTQEGCQGVINRNVIPILCRIKVRGVKCSDVAAAMKKMAHKPADANRTFSVMRRMFNLAEVGVTAPMAPTLAAMSRCTPMAGPPTSSATKTGASCSATWTAKCLNLGGNGLCLVLRSVAGDGNVRRVGCERARDGGTDASAAACHEGGLSGKRIWMSIHAVNSYADCAVDRR
jgi:hypothetical protein